MTTARAEYRNLFREWHTLGAEIDASGQGLKHPEYGRYKNITNRLAYLYPIVGDAFDKKCIMELRRTYGGEPVVHQKELLAACGGM